MVQLSYRHQALRAIKGDAVVLFVHQDKQSFARETSHIDKLTGGRFAPIVRSGDFSGKDYETAIVYGSDRNAPVRYIVVGLGEKAKLTNEKLRRAAAIAAKRCRACKAKSFTIFLPSFPRNAAVSIAAMAEGACLALYKFDKYLQKKNENGTVGEIIFSSDSSAVRAQAQKAIREAQIVCEAVYFARDLGNAPGGEIYPETLAHAAEESALRSGYSATILDKNEIADLKMGGILGVSQGSAHPPRFIILEYGKEFGQKPLVLVGKGVTFDAGGISLKPAAGMSEMKMDMSGAGAVLGTFEAVARLKLRISLIGLIPAVENMPGGSAIRPGDILRHYNGKTTEVDNTDAEGRLILADALGYAEKYKPAAVIDLATLTGACVVALGHHAAGMMGNDDALMSLLNAAGTASYERLWKLPLFDEYEKQIKSDIADVKNTGGRWGGAITGGWFLKKFIGKYRWAHLDIAGPAMLEEPLEYAPRGASGFGVRLLVEFVRNWKRR